MSRHAPSTPPRRPPSAPPPANCTCPPSAPKRTGWPRSRCGNDTPTWATSPRSSPPRSTTAAERRRARRISEAKFPRLKRLAEFNVDAVPSHRPATLAHLATGAYMDAGEPVVLLGDSGTGKSHLLIGLGPGRLRTRPAGSATSPPRNWSTNSSKPPTNGVLSRVVGRYGRLDLLCLDELGYVQIDPRGAELLFQIITEREERASSRSPPICRSANGEPSSPTHAWSPPSSTGSPSTPTSSRPAPSPTGYAPARPPPDANAPADHAGARIRADGGAKLLDDTHVGGGEVAEVPLLWT